jgi:predicted RNA polymerase sigma factor
VESSDVSDLSFADTEDSTGVTSPFLSLEELTRVAEGPVAEGRVTVLFIGAVVLRVKVPLTRVVLVTGLTVEVLARSCVLFIVAVLSMRCRLVRAGASMTGVAVTLAVESRDAVLEGNSAD